MPNPGSLEAADRCRRSDHDPSIRENTLRRVGDGRSGRFVVAISHDAERIRRVRAGGLCEALGRHEDAGTSEHEPGDADDPPTGRASANRQLNGVAAANIREGICSFSNTSPLKLIGWCRTEN